MANVIVLVQDDRARRQVEQYLTELEMEDLRFASFKTNREFQELYFRDRSQDPAPAPPPAPPEGEAAPPAEGTGEGADLKLFSEIHLVIFGLDAIGEKSGPWLDKLKINLKKFKYWPPTDRPRMVMIKYEDDGVSKLDVLHAMLDDLICAPLDRLVFLQKIQILLALPKKVTPTFLFTQEVKMPIEISKITKIDRLSDVGLAIRNPVPLRKGLPGHFYLQLPGEKLPLEVKGKVFRSEPHPDYPGQSLVYFSYFGLNKNALAMIRRALTKAPQYKSLLDDSRQKFKYNPDDLFTAPEDAKTFTLAIIDPDDMAGNSVAQGLLKEMDRINVVTESSFQLFLHKYFESQGASATASPPKATEVTDFFATPVVLNISTSDLKCRGAEPTPTEQDLFLGHPAQALFSDPDKWLELISEKESRMIMEEAVQLVLKGRVLQKLMAVKNLQQERCAVNFKLSKGAEEGTIRVEMMPASLNDLPERATSEQKEKNLDALVLEAGFVPEDVTSWIEGLRMRAQQLGLTKAPDQLKFLVITDQERPNNGWLESKDILGLLVKPMDLRQLSFLLSENLPNKFTPFRFDNLGWSQPGLTVHVAKGVELESLSEYGATLRSKNQLVPGTMVYLRKSIYENAPNQCLAARVYACEEHPAEKTMFQVHATYFGINDGFLKFARTWIRENYASQKAASEGG